MKVVIPALKDRLPGTAPISESDTLKAAYIRLASHSEHAVVRLRALLSASPRNGPITHARAPPTSSRAAVFNAPEQITHEATPHHYIVSSVENRSSHTGVVVPAGQAAIQHRRPPTFETPVIPGTRTNRLSFRERQPRGTNMAIRAHSVSGHIYEILLFRCICHFRAAGTADTVAGSAVRRGKAYSTSSSPAAHSLLG